jgi:hypothetical protein
MNIIRALSIAAVLLIAAGEIHAQGPACGPDPTCPGAVWSAPIASPVNLNIYNLCGVGCQAIITWRQRDACGSCDISIDEIRAVPGTGCSCSWDRLFKESIAALLLLMPSPINCPPAEVGECATTWRVMTGGCWKPDNRYVDGYMSCPGASCCFATYEVCLTSGGRTFTQTGTPQMQFPCEGIVTDPECVPRCNSLPKSRSDAS